MELQWHVLLEGKYLAWLLHGLTLTVQLTLISTALALASGTLLGTLLLVPRPTLNRLARGYVTFFRNTPLVCLMFFCYFGLPVLLPQRWFGFLYAKDFEFRAAVLSLSLCSTAFVAEVIRAGINGVPRGQTEAGLSSGLSTGQLYRYVILPQAFRIVLPALGNTVITNMKDSSLAMTIAVGELTWQAQQVESYTFRGFEAITAVTVTYLLLSLGIVAIIALVESRLALRA